MRADAEPVAVAGRLFAAIEAGDLDAVGHLYAPDVVVWHNTDGRSQNREENLRTLRWVMDHLTDLRYDEVRCEATVSGFVQRHVLRATGPHGEAVEVPACLVAAVSDGHITRIDEYLDSAHLDRPVAGG